MKRISLTQGQFAIVDNKNYEWLSQWKWHVYWNKYTQSYYAIRMSKRERSKQHTIYMACEILGLKHGDKRQSDHINHNTLDNRESNLRIVSCQQNQFNRSPKGYYWDKCWGKYKAQIGLNNKKIFLGYFLKAKDAHNAYLKAKERYHKI